MPTQQLDFDFSPRAKRASKAPPKLTDLEPLRQLAMAAAEREIEPRKLRDHCQEEGLSKAGWRFLTRHGQAAWAAAEAAYNNDYGRWYGSLFYIELQIRAGLRQPANAELGQRYLAANGLCVDFESALSPKLLRLAERQLARLEGAVERAHFIETEWMEVLAWFSEEPPKLDSNQWKAGWPAIRRQYHVWQKLNPERLAWRSLLGPFTAGQSSVRPLTSSYELALEGHQMRHCVAMYTNRSNRGDYRLFSVVRAGERAARATVGIHRADRGWQVEQVKGRCNANPDQETLRVASIIANRYELAEREAKQRAKAREQLMLSRQREQHRQALRVRTLLPEQIMVQFTEREVDYLERHLHWMERLASGELQPISMAQVHFIAVDRGLAEPNTEAERLWRRYRYLREILSSGLHPTVVS